jgi:hypothetical protein
VASNGYGSPKELLSDPAFSQTGNAPYPQSYDPTDYNQAGYAEPAYPQTTYTDMQQTQPLPTYHARHTSQNFDGGYAAREGLTTPVPTKTAKPRLFAFMSSKWAAFFMAITAIQAVVCLCFEAYIFAKFQQSLLSSVPGDEEVQSQYKTIPTFLTLFIFGFLYELVVVWDALRMTNTIQIIGICLANLALVVYTAIQVDQISIALGVLTDHNSFRPGFSSQTVWEDVRAYLIAIPTIIGLVTVLMGFITFKLYQEFAWDILKNIGADYRMKKRFLHYQIYIALLKFDFFFFLGFIIQLVVIVTDTQDPEFALTIATVPITIAILILAAYFTRREMRVGMIAVIILYHGALAYFIFKLVRIYQPDWLSYYEAVQKSLTAFAVITILLIIMTIANGIICLTNFDKGLKAHILSRKKADESPDHNSVSLADVKPQPNRMTID